MEPLHSQVLQDVIRESIVAFNDDASAQMFTFLKNSGISEAEQKQVQQVWTRVHLSNQAFGRKGTPINPITFANDFIKELSNEDGIMDKLGEYATSFKTIVNNQEMKERRRKEKENNPLSARSNSSTFQDDEDESQIESIHDLKKTNGILTTLQSTTRVGNDLMSIQTNSFEKRGILGENRMGSVEKESAVFIYRRSLKGLKFTWNNKKPNNVSVYYSPLSISHLGYCEVIYGSATQRLTPNSAKYKRFKDLENRSKRFNRGLSLADVNMKSILDEEDEEGEVMAKPLVIPIVGVKIMKRHVTYRERGWTSLQCLYESLPFPALLANGSMDSIDRLYLFPVPLGISDHGSPLFIFESPAAQPMSQYLSAKLAVLLRKSPAPLLTWCMQIGATLQNIKNITSGKFINKFNILEDVFIKENGHMCIGNVTFENCSMEEDDDESIPLSACNDDDEVMKTKKASVARGVNTDIFRKDNGDIKSSRSSGTSTGIDYAQDISIFFFNLLCVLLCLSRTEILVVEPVYHDVEEEKEDELSGTTGINDDEISLNVMTGSELKIVINGHNCTSASILYTHDKVNHLNTSTLQCQVFGDDQLADISANTIEGVVGSSELIVKANMSGNVLIRCVAPSQGSIPRHAVTIRIIVLPQNPAVSMEVIELISMLEASYRTKNMDIFTNSQCMALDSSLSSRLQSSLSEDLVYQQWMDIRFALDQKY